jgi:adenine-specific DNA-methyltransferase
MLKSEQDRIKAGMSMVDNIEKVSSMSMDIEQEEKEKLKSLFPQCFVEGKLDIDKLLSICGEYIDNDFEKYKFEWSGKSECYKIAGKRSTGTLRPCVQESVNFDTTGNLYIEGDNLEVLKLLQTSYFRKIKMIYIDPPYNTGNDFVYEDDFKDPIEKYKEVTSQTTKSNPETMGRFHTNWLNMMYPRLRLAASLLRDDGVIFISIDETEIHNLKKVCDEVFGEENFVDCITWNKRVPKNDNKGIGNIHEYILVYVKSSSYQRQFLMQKDGLNEIFELLESMKKKKMPIPEAESELKKFYNKKGYDRGITLYNNIDDNYEPWGKINMSWPNGDTFGPTYDVVHPKTQKPAKLPDRGWRWNKTTFDTQLDYNNVKERHDGSFVCGNIWFAKDENTQPSSIKYLKDVGSMLLRSIISLKSDGGVEVEKIFDGKSYFSYPKPTSLLTLLINSIEEKDGIILDFFSGSATTAHAVMQLNAEDAGNRKFIMVQLPEACDEKTEACKSGYKNICEIGKERIRRAGAKIAEHNAEVDTGFKVLKLDSSNLAKWDNTPIEKNDLGVLFERFESITDTIKKDRSDIDVIYEVMLKMGVTLDSKVTQVNVNTKKAYLIGEDAKILICIDKGESGITPEDMEAMCNFGATKIVASEEAFADDTALSNAHYILKDRNIEMKLL